MERKRLQVWMPLFISVTLVIGMFLGYKLRIAMPGSSQLRSSNGVMHEVMELIRGRYVERVNPDTLLEGAVGLMLDKLDPHSVFIPAKEIMGVNEDLAGEFQGIGVEFNIFDDTVHVINVLAGGPSEKAGLRQGDRIVKVEDSVVAGRGISSDGIRSLLRGPSGTEVKVMIRREGQNKPFTITRGFIPLSPLDASYMLNDETGYIRLNKFSENTYEEFMQALEQLQKSGMRELVLDLRGNGGGIMEEAVEIADELLSGDKRIVYTEGAHVPRKEYVCRRNGLFESGPLALLMDEGSASASEVLAGALQDWERATIIGRRSFGKGLVQEQYQLSDGSALRLTVARYYTPLGRSIQKPYDQGESKYEHEIIDRYLENNDSLSTNDTAGKKVFYTPSGKKVYEGGGITPDMFIPLERNGLDTVMSDILEGGAIGRYCYRYHIAHREIFSGFRSASAFNKSFTVDDAMLSDFIRFASKDAVETSGLEVKSKDRLKQLIKAQIAGQIWRNEGFFEVMNDGDPFLNKALEVMK